MKAISTSFGFSSRAKELVATASWVKLNHTHEVPQNVNLPSNIKAVSKRRLLLIRWKAHRSKFSKACLLFIYAFGTRKPNVIYILYMWTFYGHFKAKRRQNKEISMQVDYFISTLKFLRKLFAKIHPKNPPLRYYRLKTLVLTSFSRENPQLFYVEPLFCKKPNLTI